MPDETPTPPPAEERVRIAEERTNNLERDMALKDALLSINPILREEDLTTVPLTTKFLTIPQVRIEKRTVPACRHCWGTELSVVVPYEVS